MSQYAGTAKLATTLPVPDTNSPFNPSMINAPIKANRDSIVALTNNGFYKTTLNAAKPPYPAAGDHENTGTYKLSGTLTLTGSGSIAKSSGTYKRVANLNAGFDPAYWTYGPHKSAPTGDYEQIAITLPTGSDLLVFDFDIPSDCTVTGFSMKVQPVVHASLPQFKPQFLVYKSDVDLGTTSLLPQSGVDSSADVTAYNALHSLSTTGLSTAFNAGKNRIWVKMFGEYGTNSIVGLIAYLPVVTYTRTRFGEEFGEIVP